VHDWRNIILFQADTMRSAIELLNKEALRIVIVVDDGGRLLGTVTDGDIRRGLVSGASMDTALTDIMFLDPMVISIDDDRDVVLDKMKELDILQVPVLDNDRRIVGLETLQDLLEKPRYDNPVFLMAGGFGKRLRPLTDHVPKPLLKLGTKPILETILEQFVSAGFINFYISIHYKAEMIRDYFGDGSKWNVSINYVHEEKPLGTAGALGLLPKNLLNLPILMMNGDLLTKIKFKALLDFHSSHEGEATMCVREYDFQVPYGVIKAKDHRITEIIEKPVHRFFVNAGVYVLDYSILEMVDGVSYLDMPHMLEKRIAEGMQVNMFPIYEYWMDIGQMEQFNQAKQDSNELFQ
jgi:dTDP-glucose pyrophosphorylase